MKQIKQSVEVAFEAIEIQDAIIIAPLMDAIKRAIVDKRKYELYKTLSDEEKKEYYMEDNTPITLSSDNKEEIFAVLANLGFVCSDGTIELPNPSIEDLKPKYRK